MKSVSRQLMYIAEMTETNVNAFLSPICYAGFVKIELVGLAEAAELAGVSRQTLWNWKNAYQNFPHPLAELKSGPIWQKEVIVAWLASHQEAKKTLKRKKH